MTNQTQLRSITKTALYRVFTLVIGWFIAFAITSSKEQSTYIALFTQTFAIVWYYINERIWSHIDWAWLSLEQHRRTLIKTLLYKIIMITASFSISYYITKNAGSAGMIVFIKHIITTGSYYVYDRIWTHINWGIRKM